MRAVVYDRYGPPDVLRLEEVERPVPMEDEVLVKVRAVAVTRADCATREANRRSGVAVSLISRLISGIRRPKQRILGTEFAGDVEAVGKHSFNRCKGSLKPGGSYLATDGLRNLFLALWTSRVGDKKVVFSIPPRYTKQDVLFLKELIEARKYRAVVDRCYPLEEVIEATRYVETEQKTGNVVLTV